MASDESPGSRTPGTDEEEASSGLTRRSFATLSVLAGVPAAGFLDSTGGSDGGTAVRVPTTFGYGGTRYETTTTTQTLAATSTDVNEPDDTMAEATPLGVGVDVDGYLSDQDVDWFAFDLDKGTTATVRLRLESDIGVVSFVLYDHEGEFVARRYIGGTEATLDHVAVASGTHFAQVVDVESDGGPYTIRLETDGDDSTDDDYGEQGYGEDGYGGTA